MVLSDTPVCFLQNHATTNPFIVSTDPDTDFRSVLSAAKSASLQLSILIGLALLVLLMHNLCAFDYLRYRAVRLAIFQSFMVGLCVYAWLFNAQQN